MKNLKTVPFAEYLDDVRNNAPSHNYLGFISRDGRLVAYEGISYTNTCLTVKYADGTHSVNNFNGECISVFWGFTEECIRKPENDLFAIYEDKI